MVLTIDVGNSNICVGGYIGGESRFLARIATDTRREADQYAVELAGVLRLYGVENEPVDGVAIASVVPAITPLLLRALRHFTATPPLVVGRAQAGSMRIAIDNPAELGTDIIASAIAVHRNCPLPAVIIDMGTATKLTAIDAAGSLLGVSITPGLFLSLNALFSGASLLAGISMEGPGRAIGRNSAESIQSGVIYGSAAMLDGLIDRFAAELGEVKTLVATGGAAGLVVPHCRHDITFNDNLLMDGLYLAFEEANRHEN